MEKQIEKQTNNNNNNNNNNNKNNNNKNRNNANISCSSLRESFAPIGCSEWRPCLAELKRASLKGDRPRTRYSSIP
uniref:Uncharacterized protein n=1 Tax=Vespula pensylvanica TaxID=30213 RepID=A0A834UBT6_VESPE|nr:hypothetical protein H0235_006014 [Vespula pensylvanica]